MVTDALSIHRKLLKKYGLEARSQSLQNGDAYISTILLDDKQGPLYANLMNSGREAQLPDFSELLENRLKSLIDRSGISDKDKYLIHWGYTLGTPEAERAWKEKQDFDNGHRAFATPMIFVSQDICYDSPIDGRAITSKAARMEDLARSNCVEYDPEMRKDADRARERSQLELEAKVDSFVDHQFETMPTAKREMLANELQSGIEADIVRKSV